MTKTLGLLFILLFSAAFYRASALTVCAEPATIVVPDDYSTIQAAINAANIGDTIFVREGTYEEPINQTVVVDKTLAIVGEIANGTLIKLYPAYNVTWILTQSFYEFADAMTIIADDVKISNLTIMAYPGGEISITGDRTQIMGNNITTRIAIKGSYCNVTENMLSNMLSIEGSLNTITRNHARYLRFENSDSNVIRNNTCYSINLHNSNHSLIYGNLLATTSYQYSGISLAYSNNNTVCRNKVYGFNRGLSLFFSSINTIMVNTIANSSTTINLSGSFNNTFYQNNFVDNQYWYNEYVEDEFTDPWFRETYPNTMVSTNFWDNGSLGNHWGNYNGSDINFDGIGEMPYIMKIVIGYFNGSNEEVVCGRDNFPLMSGVDINNAKVELPEWLINSLPEPVEPETQEQEIMPIALIAGAIVLVVAALGGVFLLVNFKKRKH